MKKPLIIVWLGLRGVFGLGYFILAAILIFLVAYFLGYGYLLGLKGSDSFYHLANIFWFDKFFPEIPYWYPLQNGGVVPVWGYPMLSYVIVILIERLSSLSLIGAYQLLGFLSVPLTALGLYLFVWSRLKNQTMALIGSVLYLLAPIAWVWLFDWGFYTESVSYIFVFPTLIFFDIFLRAYLKKKVNLAARAALAISVLLLALTFLTHPSTFMVTVAGSAALAFFQAFDTKPRKILDIIGKTLVPTVLIVVPALMLLGFMIFDFYSYASTTSPAPAKSEREVFIEAYPTPVGSLLGFEKIPPTEFKFGHRNIVVPPVIWIPAILGIVFSAIYSRKVLALALLAVLPVVFFHWPTIAWYVITTIPFSGYVINHRVILIFIRLFAPLAAAFGLWGIFKALVDIPTFWIKKGRLVTAKKALTVVITSVFSLTLAGYLIVNLANKPEKLWKKTEVRYGPQVFDIRDPFFASDRRDLCDFLQLDDPDRPVACNNEIARRNIDIEQFISVCGGGLGKPIYCDLIVNGVISQTQMNEFLKDCNQGRYQEYCRYVKTVSYSQVRDNLLNKDNWPKPRLIKELEHPLTRFSDFIAAHKGEKMLRIDVSPFLGGVVQTLNIESEISQINLYAVTLSLLGPYWGLEQQVFFSENTGNTINVNNLAQWFGIKYLFLEDKLDFIEKYAEDSENWELVDEAGVWKFNDATALYSWTTDKPAILVIGSKEKAAFEPVFRTSINGAFDYEDGWLVQGKENIDDYTLQELKKFDTVFLYGYSYKNRRKAFKLLDEYVSGGGNLFINTGWQFVDADWELEDTPDFFPVDGLTWSTEYGSGSRYLLEDEGVGGKVDVSLFGPLEWNGLPWGLSLPITGKRDWTRTVLSVDGKPIVVAGAYGQGKVIWTGFNLLGHINTYDFNKEEVKFFGNLLRWFGAGDLDEELLQTAKMGVLRRHPDRVEFVFHEATQKVSTLYWREAEFPNWKAKLTAGGKAQKVKIYRAGPGFMFMRLPPLGVGSSLVLEFKIGTETTLGRILTALTLLVLLLYVVSGERYLKLGRKPLSKWSEKRKALVKSWWSKEDEEEEY